MEQTTELGLGKMEEELVEITSQSEPPARKRTGMKRWKKVLLMSAGAVLLIGLVVGGIMWSRRGVVAVQTGKVMKQEISSVVTASGQIRPPSKNFANVNANTFGRITEILVKEEIGRAHV